MAIGGGIWTSQNKKIPGSYINLVSDDEGNASGGSGTGSSGKGSGKGTIDLMVKAFFSCFPNVGMTATEMISLVDNGGT